MKIILKLLKENFLIEKNYDFINNSTCKNSKKIQNYKILEFLKLQGYNFKKYPEKGKEPLMVCMERRKGRPVFSTTCLRISTPTTGSFLDSKVSSWILPVTMDSPSN